MQFFSELARVFNDRELAALFWLTAFLTGAFSSPSVRRASMGVLQTLVGVRILVPLLLMLIYIGVFVWGLNRVTLWDDSLLKNTILWVLGSAIVMFVNTGQVLHEEGYFRSRIVRLFSFMLILGYMVNLYGFPIVVEFLALPAILIMTMAHALATTHTRYHSAEKLLEISLSCYGFSLLGFSIYSIVGDFNELATVENVMGVVLAPILTVSLIPFLYLFALYNSYESVVLRVRTAHKQGLEDRALKNHFRRQSML